VNLRCRFGAGFWNSVLEKNHWFSFLPKTHLVSTMSCSHDPYDLIRVVENAASESELSRLQRQIDQCPHCQRQIAELRQTAATLQRLPRPELPAVEVERRVHALRRQRIELQAQRALGFWIRRLRPIPIAAVLAATLLLISYRAFRQPSESPPPATDELRLFLRSMPLPKIMASLPTSHYPNC